ncbi:MAG: toprim domain-containing protein [Propionicimonas sp.]
MATTEQIVAANELAWLRWRNAAVTSPVGMWLVGRGLTPAAVATAGWAPGWAAPNWRDITDLLRRHRIPTQVGVDAGLLRRAESGRTYDGFRGRVVLPIRGLHDGCIRGFTARRVDDTDEHAPKYVNSPTNAAYTKSRALFGGWEASQSLRADRDSIQAVVVCEGPFDVVRVALAGPWAAIAPCGTAMTSAQADWIVALGRTHEVPILLAYDGDTAGEAATWRAWDLLRDAGARGLCLADIPEGRDPGELTDTELAAALQLPQRRVAR